MAYNEKKPGYTFAGNDGTKPVIIQDGRIYDIKGVSLDAQFSQEDTAENLIQWLWRKGYCISPEARSMLIKEKRRVALERQSEELIRRNDQLMREETERIEAQLAESEKEMRAQVELHLKQPEMERQPLTLTRAEEEALSGRRVDVLVPEGPDMEDLAPQEMAELAVVAHPKSKRKS